MDIFKELQWRGCIKEFTNGTDAHLQNTKSITVYIGFDPTAPSLHIGSLLPIMCLARFQRYGHSTIAIVGGGTGMIGDPSGKQNERKLLTIEEVNKNLHGIKQQLSRFLRFDGTDNPAHILNNAEWLVDVSLMDFLRDTGKHFTTNYMRAKDSVKKREEEGISFTEFSYMLLQAYDYFVLNKKMNCTLQMGGSDQWGNIIAGIDLIWKRSSTNVFGLTFPLVTTSSGIKFGKTESGTIWLDANLTLPYEFHQFWLNVSDQDAIMYLKYFTWLNEAEIQAIQSLHTNDPARRLAQSALADEVTKIVHGENILSKVKAAAKTLFEGSLAVISVAELTEMLSYVPSTSFSLAFGRASISVVDFLCQTKLCTSKSRARQLLQEGGIYINNQQANHDLLITRESFGAKGVLVVRKGKKSHHIIKYV